MPEAATSLDPRRIERVLSPLSAGPPGLRVWFADPDGHVVAGSADPSGTANARDVVVDDVLIGRLLASGPDSATAAVAAALDALAVALAEIAGPGGTSALIAAEADGGRFLDAASSRQLDALEADIALGRQQQRRIVSIALPEVPGYELASHYEPAREIGGDFYELFRLRGHGRSIGIVIADVTGKGIAAGLLMAFSRPVLHGALDLAPGPADALERTNRILVEERRSTLFITALAATLELRTGAMVLANAGHECPLLVPADGTAIRPLGEAGVMLGAFRTLGLDDAAVSLQPGDLLFLYTDGVTDARNVDGERFGDDRLLATLEAARTGSADDVVAAVRDAVDDFQATVEPADDVTIVAVRRTVDA